MRPHDVPTVTKLLRSYLRQFKVSSHFEEAEVTHWFLQRDEVVYTYVVVNPQTDPVTDFFSFFARHSSPYKLACSFYHVTSETSIQKLMRHALIVANENGFYTFIALDIMGNKSFFKKPSSQRDQLHIYIYTIEYILPAKPVVYIQSKDQCVNVNVLMFASFFPESSHPLERSTM